jgi:hypothetical protein
MTATTPENERLFRRALVQRIGRANAHRYRVTEIREVDRVETQSPHRPMLKLGGMAVSLDGASERFAVESDGYYGNGVVTRWREVES